MTHVRLLLLASEFSVPRVDFDLHPGTLAFMILCITLIGGVITGIIVLSLYAEESKREAAHHDTWIDGSDAPPEDAQADASDVEPFISDEARPDVSYDGVDVQEMNVGAAGGDEDAPWDEHDSFRNPDRVQE